MSPRHEILPVPYALSLRPGATIIAEREGGTILSLFNVADTGHSHGIVSGILSDEGVAGYFQNPNGPAILADGNPGIRSTAPSYIWISGNGLRKKRSTDPTVLECDLYGGVLVSGGSTRDVMLPVSMPGVLYGQNVTLTRMQIYIKTQTSSDKIIGTYVRRGTGTDDGVALAVNIQERQCIEGCSYPLIFETNNQFASGTGPLYIAFKLQFSDADNWIQIGGVSLKLEHD